jgi:predicted nucleic acid-binding protein
MYLLDTGTLAEALRAVPSRQFVRRLSYVQPGDRWTSVITVSHLLEAARRAKNPKLMQNVLRLVASVRVASFDLQTAQAVANDFTLVSGRPIAFRRYHGLRVESWTS